MALEIGNSKLVATSVGTDLAGLLNKTKKMLRKKHYEHQLRRLGSLPFSEPFEARRRERLARDFFDLLDAPGKNILRTASLSQLVPFIFLSSKGLSGLVMGRYRALRFLR